MPSKLGYKDKPQPRYRTGFALFVKLWQLDAGTPANDAYRLTTTLDSELIELCGCNEERFFPSPYGGAILLQRVEDAIVGAVGLMSFLNTKNIEASIAITHGTFEKVYNVTRWNTAALALNIAARMAFWLPAKGEISVSPAVKHLALKADSSFKNIFGPDLLPGEVKGYCFTYWNIDRQTITAEPTRPTAPRPNARPSFSANILVVDIEGYSKKSADEQQRAVDSLNRCLERTLSATGAEPTSFGPAGDGGYFVFPSDEQASAPQALLFARELITHARSEDIHIRTGISFGPVVKTDLRPAVGGTILDADRTSALARRFGLAVSSIFWDTVPEPFRAGWSASEHEAAPGLLALTLQALTRNEDQQSTIHVRAEDNAFVEGIVNEADALAGSDLMAARNLVLHVDPGTHHLLASKLEDIRRLLRQTRAYVLPSGERVENFRQMADAVLRNPAIGSLTVEDPLFLDWLCDVLERPDLASIVKSNPDNRWETLLRLIESDTQLPRQLRDAVDEFRQRDATDMREERRDSLLRLLSRDPDCLAARLRLAGGVPLPAEEVICRTPEYRDHMGLRFVRVPARTAKPEGARLSVNERTGSGREFRDAFWISRTPVTVGAYAMWKPTSSHCKGERHWPVVNVDWHSAASYCKGIGARLPTEDEWEYAARGGLADCVYPWGNQISQAHALYGSAATFPWRELMRKFFPNRFGLFDMAGGLWEWCSDGLPDRKIVKGGSWRSKAEDLRLSHREERNTQFVGAPLDDTGFRCVLL